MSTFDKQTNGLESKLVYASETYLILGACFEVYRDKGCGFLEPVYQECLEIEFGEREIPFVSQKRLTLTYKGRPLQSVYQPDFVCFDKIVVEIKSVSSLADEHRAQTQNYLRATGFTVALLVNFGFYPKAQVERIVAERGRYHSIPSTSAH